MTEEKVREAFIEHIWTMINYWENLPDSSERSKLEGIAFSILTAIDGDTLSLPKFILAPDPHPDDKYEVSDPFPENHMNEINCDISGGLHEHFFKLKP